MIKNIFSVQDFLAFRFLYYTYINERSNLLKYYSTFINNFELAFYIPTKISIYLSWIWSRSRRDFFFQNDQPSIEFEKFLFSQILSASFDIEAESNRMLDNTVNIVKPQKIESRQIIISFKKKKIQRCDKKKSINRKADNLDYSFQFIYIYFFFLPHVWSWQSIKRKNYYISNCLNGISVFRSHVAHKCTVNPSENII